MIELLFLLLPLAAASGWWAARHGQSRRAATARGKGQTFFVGLNYLLDEQPDKAIDVFLQLAEVDRDTVETHLALGSLFRRRGEVDRAIRVHQNVVARTNLDREQRGYALHELGQDYMRAGLFDRAESMFRELLELKLQSKRALKALMEIYQQEKDWLRCLEVAQELQTLGVDSMKTEIAQYHCELAEEALRAGSTQRARDQLAEAQASDPSCVRAIILEAEMARAHGDDETALGLYRHIVDHAPQYLPEILPNLSAALAQGGDSSLATALALLRDDEPSPALMIELAQALRREQGDEAAAAVLMDHLSRFADLAALAHLIELRTESSPTPDVSMVALGVIRHLLARQPAHLCQHCGFAARRLHWQCPSCKRWATIHPFRPEPLGVHLRTEPA